MNNDIFHSLLYLLSVITRPAILIILMLLLLIIVIIIIILLDC